MTSCVFRYCKNTTKNCSESSGVSFHRFVHPGHANREDWIKNVQKDRSEDTWLPTKHSYICSAHFLADDFYATKTGRRFIKKSAIPCSIPSECTDKNPQASPTSSDTLEISDTESIFDTAQMIELKKKIKKVSAARKALAKKNTKLQRQNKYLQKKTKTLTAIVQQFKDKFGINIQIENEVKKLNCRDVI